LVRGRKKRWSSSIQSLIGNKRVNLLRREIDPLQSIKLYLISLFRECKAEKAGKIIKIAIF